MNRIAARETGTLPRECRLRTWEMTRSAGRRLPYTPAVAAGARRESILSSRCNATAIR
jgi:hypothetical protein